MLKIVTREGFNCTAKATMRLVYVFILVLIAVSSDAANFIKAELKFTDGKTLKGLATFPDKPDDKSISFKSNDKADAVKYESELLKTLVYHFDDGDVEFDRIMIIPSLTNGTKTAGPYWLEVVERGYTTLYFALRAGSTVVRSGVASTQSADKFWYCLRPGEPGAKVISWVIGKVNANATFMREGQKYFADYPELAQKIKDKTYRYDQITEAVKEYNKWVAEKGKK
jgi:hypothetical protein